MEWEMLRAAVTTEMTPTRVAVEIMTIKFNIHPHTPYAPQSRCPPVRMESRHGGG